MLDIMDVLNRKEREMETVKREIDALRVVAPLLVDDVAAAVSEPDEILQKDGTTGLPVRTWP